jgi:predicted O-methyltransferase YrrM
VSTETITALFDRPDWEAIYQQQAARGILTQLKALPDPAQGAEIGVNRGLNSWFMIKECSNIKMITGVDHYLPYVDWDRPITKAEQDHSYEVMQSNIPLMNGRFELLRTDSQSAAETFPDDYFDFVFIDGGHSMKQVLADLDSWTRKVRAGGLVAGHDANLFSVNFAVSGWCRSKGINKELKMGTNDCWYFFKS